MLFCHLLCLLVLVVGWDYCRGLRYHLLGCIGLFFAMLGRIVFGLWLGLWRLWVRLWRFGSRLAVFVRCLGLRLRRCTTGCWLDM
jgi:hypothetical protein